MASRWIRWHTTAHIWEYSTDNGTNWTPLPLNASILTEGTLDPARLPAGLPAAGGNNNWTGVNTITHVSPSLNFVESDQGVDLKRWSMYVDAQAFRLTTTTDAGAGLLAAIVINRTGAITGTATIGHQFNINAAGNHGLFISNPDAGSGSAANLTIGNNAGARLVINAYSTNWANQVDILCSAPTLYLQSPGAIGLVINGVGRLNANTTGVQITGTGSVSGTFSVGSYLYANAGLVEYGRPYVQGQWIDVAYNPVNFFASSGTWNTSAGAVSINRYAVIGKTLFYHVAIGPTSITAATTFLNIALPVTLPGVAPNMMCLIYNGVTAGWAQTFVQVQWNVLQIFGHITGAGWPTTGADKHVQLYGMFQLA